MPPQTGIIRTAKSSDRYFSSDQKDRAFIYFFTCLDHTDRAFLCFLYVLYDKQSLEIAPQAGIIKGKRGRGRVKGRQGKDYHI